MIKYLLPYGIVQLYRRYKNSKDNSTTADFEGIFKNFGELKLSPGAGFMAQEEILWALDKAKNQFEKGRFEVLPTDIARLSLLINLLTRDNCVEVYDIGGGAGHTYFNIYHHIRDKKRLFWSIFEQPKLIRKFSKFIITTTKLSNLSINSIEDLNIDKNEGNNKLNVLHMRSVLHYFEKPFDFLRRLMPNVEYIFLCRLPTSSEISTFVSKQNMYSTAHPCWFFNLNEITKFFEENGYEIIEIWNELEKFDMQNFPDKYKLDHCRGILCKNVCRA